MPKKSNKEKIAGRYFKWILFTRDSVWYADGRSNQTSAGKHSLGTKDKREALEALRRLDVQRAVALRLADRSELDPETSSVLSLGDGWELYKKHTSRPRVTGGAKPASVKRYKAIFDKFIVFAKGEGVQSWNQVSTAVLENYAAWLDGEGYAYRTEYLELTTLKQAINWLQEAGHLPDKVQIKLSLHKPTGTDTYCWRPEEVAAIVAHCYGNPELVWLGDLVLALATTGLRISELAGLRSSDVVGNFVHLTDETNRGRVQGETRRETKNSRSRSFPVSDELKPVLDQLPSSRDGLLFHGPRGGRIKPDTVRNILIREVLEPLARKFPSPAGVPGFKDGRLHSFRHYFCSQCATSGGVSELSVMKWLGHQASAMVKHYFHLHDQQALEQMARVKFVPDTGVALAPVDSKVGKSVGAETDPKEGS